MQEGTGTKEPTPEELETLRRLKRRKWDREGKSKSQQESFERQEAFDPTPVAKQIDNESLILLQERPVLAVKDGSVELKFLTSIDQQLWEGDLKDAGDRLRTAIA